MLIQKIIFQFHYFEFSGGARLFFRQFLWTKERVVRQENVCKVGEVVILIIQHIFCARQLSSIPNRLVEACGWREVEDFFLSAQFCATHKLALALVKNWAFTENSRKKEESLGRNKLFS